MVRLRQAERNAYQRGLGRQEDHQRHGRYQPSDEWVCRSDAGRAGHVGMKLAGGGEAGKRGGGLLLTMSNSVQRTYLCLTLLSTLAGSFTWGINTLFLLDAGVQRGLELRHGHPARGEGAARRAFQLLCRTYV